MTDDFRRLATPATYPAITPAYRRTEFGESLHSPSTVKAPQQTRRMELPDADDYARPARYAASPLHGIPASVYADMRALRALVENAPMEAWRIDGLKLPSTANLRTHWAPKAKRAKSQRQMARASVPVSLRNCLDASLYPAKESALVVLVVRCAPRTLDRHDNLRSSAKPVIDGVADALGLRDDSDPRVAFVVAQEKGPAAVRFVVVRGRP